MPHATVPAPGLQAFILCGPGSSLSTFTSNPKDLPKAIIPIANRPMVWYALDWCYRMGVTDIILISPPESSPPLEAALATNPALTSLPSPKPEILAPADLTQTTGTAELLRLPELQQSITSDFILLPCDLISELDGTKMLQQWLTLNPLSVSMSQHHQSNTSDRGGTKPKGGLALFYPTYGLESITTKHDETDFLATGPRTPGPIVPAPQASLRPCIEQILLSMPTDTLRDRVEEDKGFLRLRSSLLSKHARVKLRTKYRDAHVYFFPRWIKDFVARNEGFESVSEDVLGWWGKASWQDGALVDKLGLRDVLPSAQDASSPVNGAGDATAEATPDATEIDIASLSTTQTSIPNPFTPGTQTPAFATRVGAQPPLKPTLTIPPLLAYIQPATPLPRPLIRRIDTPHQLLTISLHLAKQTALSTPLAPEHKIHPTAHLELQSRVAAEDCLVAENVKVGGRSVVKECVIGAGCEIGRGVRLTRCLLMEGVVVGDGVVMVGCIVGRRARVEGGVVVKSAEGEVEGKKGKGKGKARDEGEEEKTKLTDCEVAPGFLVEAGTEARGEKFMGFDTDGVDGEGGFEDEEEEEEEEEEGEVSGFDG